MKHHLTRRAALLAVPSALAMPALIGRAQAATTWRMASKMPAESSEGKVYQRFADLAKQYTDGSVDVQVYPSEQLGKEAAVLEQLQIGTVHIYVDDAFFMQKWVPDIKWITPSFVFDTREHWVRFMKTPLVTGWFDQVKAKVGIMTLPDLTAVVRGPFRVLAATRAIKGLDDLKDLRIRMYPDELANGVWSALGVETRIIGWTDTYQSIRTGVVQGVTSPIALVEDLKFQEVAPFITRTDEFFQGIAFMTNARAFDRLTDAQKQGLTRAHAEAGTYSQALMSQVADQTIGQLKTQNANYLTIDTKPIVARARVFYDGLDSQGKLPAGYFAAVEAARSAA